MKITATFSEVFYCRRHIDKIVAVVLYWYAERVIQNEIQPIAGGAGKHTLSRAATIQHCSKVKQPYTTEPFLFIYTATKDNSFYHFANRAV